MIGIDLGTTNSLVCLWEETGVRLLKNRFGDYMTPSVVSFDKDGTVYVGKTAKERLITHPEVTFKEFKRDMGTNVTYKAYGKTYRPEELSALVLKQLKEDAEKIASLEDSLAAARGENQKLRRQVEYLGIVTTVAPGREEVERTRALLARLVREIDKCIADLND